MRHLWKVLLFALGLAIAGASAAGEAPGPGTKISDCKDCPEMVVVPGGSFMMGDDKGPKDELPIHRVTLRAFAVARTEVTRAQFAAFAKETGRNSATGCLTDVDQDGRWQWAPDKGWADPGLPTGDDYPATCINWFDAKAYADWLSHKTGRRYRLLSEAEYEYALRGGTTSEYWWGDDPNKMCRYANGPDSHVMARFPAWHDGAACEDGYDFLAPVASFEANGFGLYDMAGNAWEWTADCYAPDYTVQPRDGTAYDPEGCSSRVTRGGSMGYAIFDFRSAQRNWAIRPYLRGGDVGFRVAREL